MVALPPARQDGRMTRITSATSYRAAAACVAAAALSLTATRQAAAQQTVDLFGGTLGTPTSLSIGGIGNNTTASTTGTFGPGFNGTVTLGVGALNTLSEGFGSLGTSNYFTITTTGVAAIAGSTSASKTYTGTTLTPGGTYALTLTRTTGFTVGALSSVNLTLSANNVPFVNTAPGSGLLGSGTDLLNLFGSNGIASFQFTVPSTATGALGLTITSNEPIGAVAGSYQFTAATLSQVVPEPGSVAASLLGAGALTALRFRRRLRGC